MVVDDTNLTRKDATTFDIIEHAKHINILSLKKMLLTSILI